MNEAAADHEISRDKHLFGPGPKQILSLDGGGVGGAITLAFLERIETLLQQRYGKDFCLGEHFDLVGGTSAGAVMPSSACAGAFPCYAQNLIPVVCAEKLRM